MNRLRTKNILYCTTIFLCISLAATERWSRQVPQHGFLPHQINDWIPVQSQLSGVGVHTDRSLRFAQFPSQQSAFGVNSFASPAQAQYNPFSTSQKFGFSGTVPQAQALLQQQQQVMTPQQLQSVEGGVSGQDTPIELLYVPLETLQKQGFQGGNQNRYNVVPQTVNAALINNFYESGTVEPVAKTRFLSSITTTTNRPVTERHNPFQSSPTAKSTLKPYQPPLAMFLLSEGNNRATVNDVLAVLKRAHTIDVLDAPSEKRPNVFIGPSDMTPPDGYSKFELPYLSHLDTQRTGRKIENLPFFVAPLSYHTPNGFGKIPLPAPHVGSVVVNTPLSNKQEESQFFGQNQINGAQSQRFGFNQDKFNHQGQFVSSTVVPPSQTNRFNSNHFVKSSHSTPTSHSSSTNRPVTSRPNSQAAFNDIREEHFNTEKQRIPANRHPQQTAFSSSVPTKARPTKEQYHEEVTETPLPETQYSNFEASTTQKVTSSHRRPTAAQTAQSSISYQTAPSRQPSSQFFEESFQSPSSTIGPSTNFFSGFAPQNPFNDQQFVHKFKLVESVKPNYKATKEPDFFSFNNNPFSNGYSTLKTFSPPPAPIQQTDKNRFIQSFSSSTSVRPTNKRPNQSSTFPFTPSSVKPVIEDSFLELTTIEPVSAFTPTSSFHSTILDSHVNINGQSPANIHQQNILETTKQAYDPYKVPSTEKTVPVRGGANSNYRQSSSKIPVPTTENPQNFAFNSRRPVPQQEGLFNDGTFVNRFSNQKHQHFTARPTVSEEFTSLRTTGRPITKDIPFDSRPPVQYNQPQKHHSSRPTKITSSSVASQEQPSTFSSSEDFSLSLQTVRPRPSTTMKSQTTKRPEQSHRVIGSQSQNRGTRPTDIHYHNEENQEQYHKRPQSIQTNKVTSPKPTTTKEVSYEITGTPDVHVVNNNVHEVQKDHIQLTHPSSQVVSEGSIYDNLQTDTPILSTDAPTAYNTPNDLPPISPMLPGLINSLTDDRWMEPKEEVTTTTTTHRPFIRGRRPLPVRESSSSTRTSQSSESGSSTRTVSNTNTRARRPLTTRFNKTSTETSSQSSSTGTVPVSSTRTQAVRNNRVRYNPTPEERQRLRSRGRPQSSAKPAGKDEKDIDYQRDVLNQNYPIIKPRVTQAPISTSSTTAPTTTTTTEISARETFSITEENVVGGDEVNEPERIPINHAVNYRGEQEHRLFDPTRRYPGLFKGFQEEMILPQEHLTTLYEEQEIVTEPIFDQRKSVFKQKARVNPIFTTARPSSSKLTTTTEIPAVETTNSGRRRPTFPRRQSRPLTTTHQPPLTTESLNEDVTVKSRSQPTRGGLRIRERRPVNEQTTIAPVSEVSSRRSYQSRVPQHDLEEDGVFTSRKQNFPARTSGERDLKRANDQVK